MALRGVLDLDQADTLMRPSLEALHDPYKMRGMDIATTRLKEAVAENHHVRAVTDYDVDGTTSSLILQATLKALGHQNTSYHIPHRMEEGYGFSVQAAEQAAAEGVSLLLTADIGVKDHESVRRAHALGVDVIICDHHLPPEADVPQEALAVLCPPQEDCSYPNPHLAACGISLKVAQAMLANHPLSDRLIGSMLKLAALGTVADVVDLGNAENRAIVSLGLEALNRGPHSQGLTALLQNCDLQPGRIDSQDLGFRVGPRINAAGRLASATTVVELLTTRDPGEARRLAGALEQMNQDRRKIQDKVLNEALEQLPEEPPPAVVARGRESEGWHRGITGIVAARLRDRFHRPAVVITETSEGAVGSMRSTPKVHALNLLDAASEHLERYGGHPQAAGFSLQTQSIAAFEARLSQAVLDQVKGVLPPPERTADLRLESREINAGVLDSLAPLAPHGKGNPVPRIWIQQARISDVRVLKDRHLKARLHRPGREKIDLIWWGGAEHRSAFDEGGSLDLLGTLSWNHWQGRSTLQITLEDARLES